MDNTNKVALGLGFGALGTVLAYYGYSQIGDDNIDKEVDKIVNTSDISRNTTHNLKSNDTEDNKLQKEIKKEIEKAKEDSQQTREKKTQNLDDTASSTVQNNTVEKDNGWSQYWQGEYENNNVTPQETSEETIAVL